MGLYLTVSLVSSCHHQGRHLFVIFEVIVQLLELSLLVLSGRSVKTAVEWAKLYFSDKTNPDCFDVFLLARISPEQVLPFEVVFFYFSRDQISEESFIYLFKRLLSFFLEIRFSGCLC